MTYYENEIPRHDQPIKITLREYDKFNLVQSNGAPMERPLNKKDKTGPLNVVFLTSIRDTGGEDKNGVFVPIQGEYEYMMGLIEAVNTAINNQLWSLDRFIRIRGIITDDRNRENHINTSEIGLRITNVLTETPEISYPAIPTPGKPWIYPLDAVNDEGTPLVSITKRIPSEFRTIPLTDKERRNEEQRKWEDEVYNMAQEMGADIVISDHIMVRIKHLINDTKFGLGRVLNIHPAISDPKNPNRLPGSTPTKDAIMRARTGFVFDKKSGLYLTAIRDKKTGELVQSKGSRYASTGASLHILDKHLDNGPVIADSESTMVMPTDTEQELRFRNYKTKIAVFIRGIMHYVRKIYPDVERINFKTGEIEESQKTVLFK